MKTIQLPRLGNAIMPLECAWNVTQIEKKRPENRNNVIGNA